MLKFIILLFVSVCGVYGYFTLPGKCPENVQLQEEFRPADFFNKWYQAYHYSSDGQNQNNCSVIELQTRATGIYLNQSRVDRGLFHRYSIAKVGIPTSIEDGARLDVTFSFDDAPRRFYVWILSRNEVLNDVSKELAIRSLPRIGVDPKKLVKDDWSRCAPKYYEDRQAEPLTFRYPVFVRY
uniref:Lipocalin/cytosolic fatty-acid binding domain-containing protein n=1 Tax=Heliothis virescens TaxID=7102 RepID=A0A2A4JTF5_HELVI